MIKSLLTVLVFSILSFGFADPAHASQQTHLQQFVKLANGREIYVDYLKAAPGQPTAVFLNGLTYRLGCWDAFTEQLRGGGLGILRYDMQGQGETLLKYAPILAPISVLDQVDDLAQLLDAVGLTEPVHLVTLSYGGGVGVPFLAQHPERVANLILMAPFVAPIQDQDNWINYQVEATRLMYPANPATDAELYDYFLHVFVYQTYPSSEPIVLENPYKLEATFRIVQGARTYFASNYTDQLPAGKVHLMVALKDQYVPFFMHEQFWNQVPLAAHASRIYLKDSTHKIPEVIPAYAAAWVKLLIKGDSFTKQGLTFDGDPSAGTAQSGPISLTHLGK